jgi:hypothetical protein
VFRAAIESVLSFHYDDDGQSLLIGRIGAAIQIAPPNAGLTLSADDFIFF